MPGGYANPAIPVPGQGAGGPGDFDGPYYWNADPEAGYWQYLMQHGLTGNNNRQSQYAQSQYNSTYNRYRAVAGEDPNMGFWDYLQKAQPDLATEYQNQSPEQRGDFSTRMLTPRARWTPG